MNFVVKVLLTSIIITLASELAKRWTLASTLLLALPFSSLLALTWVYIDSKDKAHVAELSWGIFWLVPPSLVFFPVLSLLLEHGYSFPLSLAAGVTAAVLTYVLYAKILGAAGITF